MQNLKYQMKNKVGQIFRRTFVRTRLRDYNEYEGIRAMGVHLLLQLSILNSSFFRDEKYFTGHIELSKQLEVSLNQFLLIPTSHFWFTFLCRMNTIYRWDWKTEGRKQIMEVNGYLWLVPFHMVMCTTEDLPRSFRIEMDIKKSKYI